jgi:hypothetical protein
MPSHIRARRRALLPVMMPSTSSSADVRVLWIEPTHQGSLGGLVEADTIETLLMDRPTSFALTTLRERGLLHRRPDLEVDDLYTVDIVPAIAHGEDWERTTEEPSIERLSETLWIRVGEVRQLFERVLQAPVYVYVTEEGAFVVDSIFEMGRAACVMRRGSAHLMLLVDDEMIDEILENNDAVASRVEEELRKELNK